MRLLFTVVALSAATALGAAEPQTGTRLLSDHNGCSSQPLRVITRDQIERSGSMTVADALRRAPSRSASSLPECRQDSDSPADEDSPAAE